MMNLRTSARVLALGAAIATVGCDDDDDFVSPTQTAQVRVVNLNPNASSVGLFADGAAVGSSVAFGSAGTSCISVPIGRALTFRTAGQTTNLANIQSTGLTANQPYTIVLYGSGTTPQTAVLSDNGITAPAAGNAAIRFFNASGAAGDIYVTAPNATLPTTPNVGNLLGGQASTTFGTYRSENTQVRIYPTGTTTTPAFSASIVSASLAGNRTGTVFLTNAVNTGGANASITVAPCT
jgi:hypothetical protein